MIFVPKFDTKFGGPIRDNIIVLLQTNEADAFLWANNGTALPPTKEWRKSVHYNTLSPVTSVVLLVTAPAQSDDDSRLDERHEINIIVDIQGAKPDDQVVEAETRIRAYDAILRKATVNEILAGMEVGKKCGGFDMEIGEHNYNYFYNEPTSIYRTTVFFVVSVHMFEIRHQGA